MVRNNTSGFTLIETTIAMTISSGLAIIALMGFVSMRGQAQFSSSVEQAVGKVTSVRNQANSTVKESGGGTDTAHVTFAKIMAFTPGSSDVSVKTYYTNTTPTAASPVRLGADPADNIKLDWGITPVAQTYIAFARSPLTGELYAVNFPVATFARITANTLTFADFPVSGAGSATIQLKSPDSRLATITVNLASGGVTRTYP